MLVSLIYVVLFFFGMLGILLYPKTAGRLNGYKIIIMSVIPIFCYCAFAALLYSKLRIPVNLLTSCISLVIANIAIWGMICKKKQVQKLFWPVYDMIVMLGLAAAVIGVSVHMFTYRLMPAIANSDYAVHFQMAMTVAFQENVWGMYFSPYVNASFIELLLPFLGLTKAYKAFIFADIVMHILELWMFYALIRTISSKSVVKYFAPILTLMYFFGYPLYSYTKGCFVYWSMGVMVFLFIIYCLLMLERWTKLSKEIMLLLVLGCYGNIVCHKLYAVVNTAAVFVALLALAIKGKEKKHLKKIFLISCAIVSVFVLILSYYMYTQWGSDIRNLMNYMTGGGGIYRALYGDIIYFLPILVALFYFVFRERRYSKIICNINIIMILIAVVMFICWYNGYMSNYFYFKIYYNLWMLGWLSAGMMIDVLADQKQQLLIYSYGSLVVTLMVISVSDFEVNMWHHNPNFNGDYAMNQFMPLYNYNSKSLKQDYEEYRISSETLKVFEYCVDEYWGEYVPIAVDNEAIGFWYDGMMDIDSASTLDCYLSNMLAILDYWQVDKIVVVKTDETYQKYQIYFEMCNVIYESQEAAVLSVGNSNWLEKASEALDDGTLELFEYVRDNLKGVKTPLLADESSYMEYAAYSYITTQDSTLFYPWKFEPKEGIENLNENGAVYVVVLKNDAYYQQNQRYFDAQEIVFENDAGMLILPKDGVWSTRYE